MNTTKELCRYKKDIEAEYGCCQTLTAQKDVELKNCDDTSDRKAKGNVSWIDYWRAMCGRHGTRFTCGSCGKLIFTGEIPKIYEDMYNATGDNAESHRACGAHLWVNTPASGKYHGGRYIAPLCPACNAKHGRMIPVLKGTVICHELGATDNK